MNFLKSFLLSLFLIFSSQAHAQSLVLVVDISESMDFTEQSVQFGSYAKLLSDDNIKYSLQGKHVEVVLFGLQVTSISSGSVDDAIQVFSILADPKHRNQFVYNSFDMVYLHVPIGGYGPGAETCVGKALSYVSKLDLPEPIVIDISGDGKNACSDTTFNSVDYIVEKLTERDVVVNSLPMGDPEISAWYQANVTTGFQIPASSIDDFEEALYLKLMAEIAMLE